MKNVLIVLLLLLLALMGWMWNQESQAASSLSDRLNTIEDSLNFTHNALLRSNQNFDLLKRENDSLVTLALSANKPLAPEPENYSAEEKSVHQLVYRLQNGWEQLFRDKDTDKFLSLFMPEFTTNEVTINTQNIPHVERHNNTNFVEHITALANTADLRADFSNTQFLSTFVKDNIFTITYQTQLEIKDPYQTVQKSKIICYVSGERVEGMWKVGNYSWTRYDFMENKYQAAR